MPATAIGGLCIPYPQPILPQNYYRPITKALRTRYKIGEKKSADDDCQQIITSRSR
jgi:hypothetical protein